VPALDDLLARPAARYRAAISAPKAVEPLVPFALRVDVPGYSGPATLLLYDARQRPAGVWELRVRDGMATVTIEAVGALGTQQAFVLINQQIAGVARQAFQLDAQTAVETGQPRFDELYPRVQAFMAQDVTAYALDGMWVRGYRSPDNNLLWLRDHTYQARGFRYFERDVFSLIDAFRRAQRPDGSFPDWLARPEFGIPAGRKEVEADVEYLFVQAVYEAWQTLGDEAWLKGNLEAMRRAVRYSMSDPLRWDRQHGLVKRPYTIDTWDFAYGPTTTDPVTGRSAPRHWIDDRTIWGIFHGDNTGLAHALELLARMETRAGNPALAAEWRVAADGMVRRLNRLSWNGRFYTHFVSLQPFDTPGVEEAEQLSLSNAYALNRGILRARQGRAIVEEYFRRKQANPGSFAEWYSIDPPFPSGSYGLAGRPGERPGEYVNGGIMPLVGGELARGAFRFGTERYAFDILARYHFLLSATNASYLWYYPAGNPGISGPDTLPTDGWGASAMLGALIEGAAGIVDDDALYRQVTISPRWTAAGDVTEARVVARYAASEGYAAYRWRRVERGLTLHLTGSGERAVVWLLLPEEITRPVSVTLNGRPATYEVDDVFGSTYVRVEVAGNGMVEVGW
jgi:hypothetical protein